MTRVVDGDSIECDPVGRVRLLGIDAPEGAQEPFGDMSREALERLLPRSGVILLEADAESRDGYGRALRYLWTDEGLVNRAMVREGYALLFTRAPNVQHATWLRAAQEEARAEGVGLWAVDGFACVPEEYRRGECR